MRLVLISSFVLALALAQVAAAQTKRSDQTGVVTLKPVKAQPKPKPNAAKAKPKPKASNAPDQTGVVSLKDDKAKDAARRDKVTKLVQQQQAEDAKRRDKISKLVQQQQQSKPPTLLPFENPKRSNEPPPTLLPFEKDKPAPAEAKKKAK